MISSHRRNGVSSVKQRQWCKRGWGLYEALQSRFLAPSVRASSLPPLPPFPFSSKQVGPREGKEKEKRPISFFVVHSYNALSTRPRAAENHLRFFPYLEVNFITKLCRCESEKRISPPPPLFFGNVVSFRRENLRVVKLERW